jgi:hypothetical protein
MRSAFTQLLQFGDERVRPAGEVAVVLPNFLSVAIEHDDGRKSLNFVLPRELLILLSQLDALGFGTREVHLHKHKLLTRVILELRLGPNLLVELPAPAAPVRAGKIEEEEFVVGRRLLLRFLVIVHPARLGAGEARRKQNTRGSGEKNRTIFLHSAIFHRIAAGRKNGTTHRRRGTNPAAFSDSPAHERRAMNGFKDLAKMLRDELGHLEHTHLAFTVEYRPE